MLQQLPEIATPNWLSQLSSETILGTPFPLHELLRDSLYYPSSAFDGDPIRHLAGNFLSFIYVDYGVSQDRYTHNSVRLKVKQHQLVGSGWCNGSGGIWL